MKLNESKHRALSNADRNAIAKTAWGAAQAYTKATGEGSLFRQTWDDLERKGGAGLLQCSVMQVHRQILDFSVPDDSLWDESTSLPPRQNFVTRVFIEVARALVKIWMQDQEDGFYAIEVEAADDKLSTPAHQHISEIIVAKCPHFYDMDGICEKCGKRVP